MLKDTDYAFATAKIRAMETKLLNREKMDAMLDAVSIDDAVKVLIEAGYGISGGESGYDTALADELKKTYDYINGIVPDRGIFNVFRVRNDYHNLKVILKSNFLGGVDDPPFVGNGTADPGKLAEAIRENKLSDLPEIMRAAIVKATDAFNATSDPQMIDIIFDGAAFEQMRALAGESKNPMLKRLVNENIDFINIRSFIRVKRLLKSQEFFAKVFLTGGKIERKFFTDRLTDSIESLMKDIRTYGYSKVTDPGLAGYAATGTLTLFEKLSDDYTLDSLRGAKLLSMGIETIIAYLYARETEFKNVRMILTGKMNGIQAEAIRERLREPYV